MGLDDLLDEPLEDSGFNLEEEQAIREAATITETQLQEFYQQLEKIPSHRSPISGKVAVLAFEFMEDTGLRITETIHVKKQDIDFKTRVLTVTHPKTESSCKCSKWKYRDQYTRVKVLESSDPFCNICHGKGKFKKPQRTTVTPRLIGKLFRYCETLKDEDLLFPTTRQSFWSWSKEAGERAGLNIVTQKESKSIEGVYLHLFRALCSLRMIRDSENEKFKDQLIARKLRHSFRSVTDRYTRVDLSYLLTWELKTYNVLPE